MSANTSSQTVSLIRRRPAIVWVVFVATMTAVGGLLLITGPAPAPHLGTSRPALDIDTSGRSMQSVFDTDVPINPNDWVQVLVHDSGSQHGSIESLARRAQERGEGSLGHHFVIGNGNGLGDGELYMSYRWMQQKPGASLSGPDAAWNNNHSISICLVGNGETGGFTDAQMQRLVALVVQLQRELGIDIDRVLMGSSVSQTSSPGRLFSEALFREQLRLNG